MGTGPQGFKPPGAETQPTFTPPESPFVDEAARDVWAAANLNLLYNADENFSYTLLETDSIAQRWSGENKPASYTASFWIDVGAGGGSLDQNQMFYVGKAGSDSRSGLNINDPKLTISAAITAASLLTPSVSNQFTIEVIDTGLYTESPTLPAWVHIDAPNAGLDGRLTLSDNTIARFRRMQNSSVGDACARKTTGTGFAKLSVELLVVADAGQEGLQLNSGVMHIDCAVITIDAGIGIKAKNGSRVSFIVSEVQITNGGLGIGTRTSGGDPNFFSGNILYAKDDGTGTILEAKVTGDTINIQAGSLIVDTLYDMGANTVLNVFATETLGNRVADPTATVNVTLAGITPLISLDTLIRAASSASSQEPASLDTPIQVEYGPAISTTQVEIDVLGTILFKVAGTYYIRIHGQYGAPAGGGESALRFRAELNGVAVGDVLSATVKDTKTSVPLTVSFFINVAANDELETFIMRDSSESNKGGLFEEVTALAGWDNSPCASISIDRLINT